MARKRKETEAVADTVIEAQAPIQELDTLPGETHGLAVTAPPMAPVVEPQVEAEEEADESDKIDPNVAKDIPVDPAASPLSAIAALGALYNEAGKVSVALAKHLRGTAGEPELHAFLMRMQTLLGEFRHSFEQVDGGMSDTLRNAIQDAFAA
jgi:hypothetical protein